MTKKDKVKKKNVKSFASHKNAKYWSKKNEVIEDMDEFDNILYENFYAVSVKVTEKQKKKEIQLKLECADNVYSNLENVFSKELVYTIANIIYQGSTYDFLIEQIRSDNIKIMKILLPIFKKEKYMRMALPKCSIYLLLGAIQNPEMFEEMFLWVEEFGFDTKYINEKTNYLYIVLYNYCHDKPKIRAKIIEYMSKTLDVTNINKHSNYHFFNNDDAKVVLPFATNIDSITNIISCAHKFDAINILMEIDSKATKSKFAKERTNFYGIAWYFLSPTAFYKVMEIKNINPYENKQFVIQWISYICYMSRWDYLPSMIQSLTDDMWNIMAQYFYDGKLSLCFVMTLFHLMDKYKIPITNLKLNYKYFPPNSCYAQFLKDTFRYNTFTTEGDKDKVYKPLNVAMSEMAWNSSVNTIPVMLQVFLSKEIVILPEIIGEMLIDICHKYKTEMDYIETLIYDDLLGWDEKMMTNFNKFKEFIEIVKKDAIFTRTVSLKWNSFFSIEYSNLPEPYKLRYVNEIIEEYPKIRFKYYKDELKLPYEKAIQIKKLTLGILREYYKCPVKDPNEFYVLPECATVIEKFIDLIENSKEYRHTYSHLNEHYINMLKDCEPLQIMVKVSITRFFVPIQEMTSIVYNTYGDYAKEEYYFLE
jgi:hypothetical protein